MSKIVERANKFANDFSANDSPVIANLIHYVAKDGYIKGATEQRDIDIKMACEWLSNNIIWFVEFDHLNGIQIDYGQLNNEFRKAMEL